MLSVWHHNRHQPTVHFCDMDLTRDEIDELDLEAVARIKEQSAQKYRQPQKYYTFFQKYGFALGSVTSAAGLVSSVLSFTSVFTQGYVRDLCFLGGESLMLFGAACLIGKDISMKYDRACQQSREADLVEYIRTGDWNRVVYQAFVSEQTEMLHAHGMPRIKMPPGLVLEKDFPA